MALKGNFVNIIGNMTVKEGNVANAQLKTETMSTNGRKEIAHMLNVLTAKYKKDKSSTSGSQDAKENAVGFASQK